MVWHLAQVNVGRLVAPLESPEVAGFVAALQPVNALADGAPGFVWRLQTEDGDATAVRAFDDVTILTNMSVWTSREALADFVYRSDHTAVMRQRRRWFTPMVDAYLALWWVPAGHRPTPPEAVDRLEALRRLGPTPHAFTFRRHFPAPTPSSEEASEATDDDRWGCPAG